MANISSEIESIENQAAKLLEDARMKARQILATAASESDRILAEEIPLNEVKVQCEQTLERARAEAKEELTTDREKGALLKIAAELKIEGIVKKIIKIVTEEY